MTCINLSYPDGPGPDDPGENRSSSIRPKMRVCRRDDWLLREGDLGRTAPVTGD